MLNHITIMGRLTKDPELRRTQSGKPVTSFTVAVDRDFSKGEADFFDCVAWNATAEFIDKYFSKGQLIVVDGRMEFRNWTDKNGQSRRSPEVVANNVYFGGKKEDKPAPQNDYNDYDKIQDEDESLPF